ncbi:MAG: hypothetical protein QOF30_1416 [Acidimicrobiaceae bacterium]|nr:hypothetical protein [Acidimicrobiaceae bacterium]
MTPNPFLVNVTSLRPTPGGRHHVLRAGRMDGLAITSSSVPAGADVVVDADVEVADGGVVVTGTVSSMWTGECRRCLQLVTGEVAASVREVFERAPRLREGDLVDADEAETYPLTGDTLDLAPLARDAILLELPLAPVCRDDCAGLCPMCGVDRNEQSCDCGDQPRNPVWAILDSLHFLPENGSAGVASPTGRGEVAGAGDDVTPDSA